MPRPAVFLRTESDLPWDVCAVKPIAEQAKVAALVQWRATAALIDRHGEYNQTDI